MDQNKVPVRGDIHVIVVGMLNVFLCNFEWNQTFRNVFFLRRSRFICIKNTFFN